MYFDASLRVYPNSWDRMVTPGGLIDGMLTGEIGFTYLTGQTAATLERIADEDRARINAQLNALREQEEANKPQQHGQQSPTVVERDTVFIITEKMTSTGETPEQQLLDESKAATPSDVLRSGKYPFDYAVLFNLASAEVDNVQLLTVLQVADYLTAHPNATCDLRAYADRDTGNPELNLLISQNRVNAVADLLVRRFGISPLRLNLNYFGDRVQPFVRNDWNRVVTVKINQHSK
jgi:outer membrane protein OmpA-like peptidoglycan-associated protein